MKAEVIERNKLITEFMDVPYKYGFKDQMGYEYDNLDGYKTWYSENHLKYHTSWDWQVKVFAKIIKLLRPIVMKHDELSHPDIEWFFKIKRQYLSAIEEDNPLQGQKILVEAIKWYNENKNI